MAYREQDPEFIIEGLRRENEDLTEKLKAMEEASANNGIPRTLEQLALSQRRWFFFHLVGFFVCTPSAALSFTLDSLPFTIVCCVLGIFCFVSVVIYGENYSGSVKQLVSGRDRRR